MLCFKISIDLGFVQFRVSFKTTPDYIKSFHLKDEESNIFSRNNSNEMKVESNQCQMIPFIISIKPT